LGFGLGWGGGGGGGVGFGLGCFGVGGGGWGGGGKEGRMMNQGRKNMILRVTRGKRLGKTSRVRCSLLKKKNVCHKKADEQPGGKKGNRAKWKPVRKKKKRRSRDWKREEILAGNLLNRRSSSERERSQQLNRVAVSCYVWARGGGNFAASLKERREGRKGGTMRGGERR